MKLSDNEARGKVIRGEGVEKIGVKVNWLFEVIVYISV